MSTECWIRLVLYEGKYYIKCEYCGEIIDSTNVLWQLWHTFWEKEQVPFPHGCCIPRINRKYFKQEFGYMWE
jgi:hypothetical protein